MITAAEAAAHMADYQRDLGIPAQARLEGLEKRFIEWSGMHEIEPMAAPPVEDFPEASLEEAVPAFEEKLVWVGRFEDAIVSWELALDPAGTLIRLRKSR
jgi:hypothetical protein